MALDLAGKDYDLKKRYDFRQIDVVRDFAPDLPPVPVVPNEITQVLSNLVKNAAHAMREGGRSGPPRPVIRTRREGPMARIEVEDNGPGNPAAIRHRVFEPFFTTGRAGGGTGLGLSVSYMVVTGNHDGRLAVESPSGKGACFLIHLPLEVAAR